MCCQQPTHNVMCRRELAGNEQRGVAVCVLGVAVCAVFEQVMHSQLQQPIGAAHKLQHSTTQHTHTMNRAEQSMINV
jgi:hypothetical protein